MPESSKLSKSIRPKEAQNNVCVVSHKLKLDREGKHDFFVNCDMVIIYSILLGKFSEGKAMIDLYHNLIIVILICHLKGEIFILLLGISLFGKLKNFITDIQSWAWFTILEPMHLEFLFCDFPIVALSSPILG